MHGNINTRSKMNIYESTNDDWGKEKILAEKAIWGDKEAVDTLARLNRKYVISIARRYQSNKYPLNGLIRIGEQGILKAAHRFIENDGRNFSSYVNLWIRYSILQGLTK